MELKKCEAHAQYACDDCERPEQQRLLDTFAAHAMQGLCANREITGTMPSLASLSYSIAEAMLAEREKRWAAKP